MSSPVSEIAERLCSKPLSARVPTDDSKIAAAAEVVKVIMLRRELGC